MTTHSLAVVLFVALVFQIGCALGVEKDPRPWTAPKWGSLMGGVVVIVAALWLAVDAL